MKHTLAIITLVGTLFVSQASAYVTIPEVPTLWPQEQAFPVLTKNTKDK